MRTCMNFNETNEKVVITFGGWDGKSYDGEGRKMNVWVSPMEPDAKFVCVYLAKYKCYTFHKITEQKHDVSGLPCVTYYTDYDANCMNK